jgi:hypothetical protein
MKARGGPPPVRLTFTIWDAAQEGDLEKLGLFPREALDGQDGGVSSFDIVGH